MSADPVDAVDPGDARGTRAVSVTEDAIVAYRTAGRARTACGLCAGSALQPVIALTPTPPATALVPASMRAADQACYPLELGRCAACGHLQLLHIVNRLVVVGCATDLDDASPAARQQADRFARRLMALMPPDGEPLAVDIGSNDGTFLGSFDGAGWRVQGIEPAANAAGAAIARGIDTHPNLFSAALAERIEEERGTAKLVVAHQYFAEAEDLGEVMDGVRILLARDGIFAFEVAYAGDIIAGDHINAITHANLAYHSVRPLKRFLASCDIDLISVERTPFRGGTLLGIAQRIGGGRPADGSVDRLIAEEEAAGVYDRTALAAFARRLDRASAALRAEIDALRAEGGRLAAYAGETDVTTQLHYAGVRADDLAFLIDARPRRRGLFSPGLHIPILGVEALSERPPEALIVLADGAEAERTGDLAAFRANGGRIVAPLAASR